MTTTDTNCLQQAGGDGWQLYNADCVPILRAMPASSVHHACFSPPYMSLYVYSASPRDIGNCADDREFWSHFSLVIPELFRIMKPGRIVAVDCMTVPMMKERDGVIGLKDFRGDLIRAFVDAGFVFHSEHCAWKDPLLEATRTKTLGLMHKQLCKDSSMCRAGLPQYLLAFRKPGVNEEPIAHPDGLDVFAGLNPPRDGNLSHERWRRYASPIWMDIDFTRTLNVAIARENEDEKHLCPMSLDMIERAMWLWSAPGEVVLSPFAGIGSEGFVARNMGRRFVGIELKPSYFKQAAANIDAAGRQTDLFPTGGASDVASEEIFETAETA